MEEAHVPAFKRHSSAEGEPFPSSSLCGEVEEGRGQVLLGLVPCESLCPTALLSTEKDGEGKGLLRPRGVTYLWQEGVEKQKDPDLQMEAQEQGVQEAKAAEGK